LSTSFAALAQHDGAGVIWADLENSFNPDWAIQRGIAACLACKGTGRTKDKKGCPECGSGIKCGTCSGTGKTDAGKVCRDCLGSGEEAGDKVDVNRLILLRPYIGSFREKNSQGKLVQGKEQRLTTAQEITSETDALVGLM